MKNRQFFTKNLENLKENLEFFRKALSELPQGALYLEKSKEKQIFLLKTEVDGKMSRTVVTKNEQMRNSLLRKELIKAEMVVLKNNIKALERAAEGYMEISLENIIAHMPARFQKLPKELWIRAMSAETAAEEALATEEHGNQGQRRAAEERKGQWLSCTAEKLQMQSRSNCNMNPAQAGKFAFKAERYSAEQVAWATAEYEQSTYKQENKVHRTSRGLMVRSKSEMIIVEKLYSYGIPFRYEEVLRTGGNLMIPDFVMPGKKYDFYYWEHCGMPYDKEYMKRHKEKLAKYESIGIAPWTNLIVTYDDEYGNFDLQAIESEIKNKLL